MTKKNEAVEVFVELLEGKLNTWQLYKCDSKGHLVNTLYEVYDDWVVLEQFHLNEQGEVVFPIGVEQIQSNSEGFKKLNTILEEGKIKFLTTHTHTGKEETLHFNRNWFSASTVDKKELNQAIKKIKAVLDPADNDGLTFLYTVDDGALYYLITTTRPDKLVANNNGVYDIMLERKKRADYALELLEIEDAIYHLSQKRKQIKAALERTNFVFTSDRNRFLK